MPKTGHSWDTLKHKATGWTTHWSRARSWLSLRACNRESDQQVCVYPGISSASGEAELSQSAQCLTRCLTDRCFFQTMQLVPGPLCLPRQAMPDALLPSQGKKGRSLVDAWQVATGGNQGTAQPSGNLNEWSSCRQGLGGSRQEVGASQHSYSTLAPSQVGLFLLTDHSHPWLSGIRSQKRSLWIKAVFESPFRVNSGIKYLRHQVSSAFPESCSPKILSLNNGK